MTSFVALYRGESVSAARLIAVSTSPDLVAHVAQHLLEREETSPDPVVDGLERGRRTALRAVRKEARRFRVLRGPDGGMSRVNEPEEPSDNKPPP